MKLTYLLINIFSVLVPFLFSFHPKIRFDQKFKVFFLAILIPGFCFLAWDSLFTQFEVWGFNDAYVTGWKIVNLPVEEILFFICIPFACVFSYHSLTKFFSIEWKAATENLFIVLLSSLLLTAGIIYIDRLYTSVTFISTSLLLLFLKFVLKVNWLSRLLTIYPVLLIPFFIVNGILTGSGLEHPIVWYNNSENLGIRLLTIPVEDVFYGFELIVSIIFFYETLQVKLKPAALPARADQMG